MIPGSIMMGKVNIDKKKFLILQELSSAVTMSHSIHEIANLLLDCAINYANAEKGSLLLATDRDELSILASRGLPPELGRNYKIKIGDGIAGAVAKDRNPLLVENIEQEHAIKHLSRNRYKTNSFISCPIIINSKLLGVLNINDKKDGTPFTIDEFELLKTLANHAAIALENAFLMGQLKSKALELEEINKKMVETDLLKTEFLTRVSHELRTPLNSLKGAIYFLQYTEQIEKKEQQEFQSIIATETDKLVSIVENLLNFLRIEDETRIVKKSVLKLEEVFGELRDAQSLMEVLSRKGIQLSMNTQDSRTSLIGDRIKVIQLFTNLITGSCHYLERGDSIEIMAKEDGHITIEIAVSRPLPDDALSILSDKRYVFQIEHPEDRLKLYLARNIIETHRWKLSARNTPSQCHLTLSVPKSVKQTIDVYVDQSMDSFVELITRLLDINICSVMLSDELTNELTVKSAIGLDADIIKRTRIKFGDKIAGWVALEGKPVFIENVEDDTRFAKTSISQYTTKSVMTLPLKIGDRVIGVLNLNNKKTAEPFSKNDYHIASQLSDKISDFIQLLHSENYQEDDFKNFAASLGSLLDKEPAYKGKKELLADFTDKILTTAAPLIKLKKTAPLP